MGLVSWPHRQPSTKEEMSEQQEKESSPGKSIVPVLMLLVGSTGGGLVGDKAARADMRAQIATELKVERNEADLANLKQTVAQAVATFQGQFHEVHMRIDRELP